MTPQESAAKPKSRSLLIVIFVVGGLALASCLGVARIAVRSFLTFGVKAKQAEVKSNLKAAYLAERSLFVEKEIYSESAEEIGFIPERGNRYRYFLAATGATLIPGAPHGTRHSNIAADSRMAPDNVALLDGIPADLRTEVGLRGTCPDSCRMTVVAVGNIDVDPTLDVWSISTAARTIDGVAVPAGTPYKHIDDVDQ